MEAPCAHCHDTGSLSMQMDGALDCQYCEATTQRIAMRDHLAQFTGWPQNDVTAWAAYLFAQRQAAPVAQPAQQVEAVGQYVMVPVEMTKEMKVAGVKLRTSQNTSMDGVWAAIIAAAPQLEAQQTGDVALKAARYDWLVANVRSGSIGFDDWWINGDEPASEWNASIDAAIAQGRKA